MLDYCCYGSLVARWLVGGPATAVMGMRANLNSDWGDAEDNAAMLIRFPQAMALCEASWTTYDHGVSPGPIVYGTEGTLVVDKETADQPVRVRIRKGAGETGSTTSAVLCRRAALILRRSSSTGWRRATLSTRRLRWGSTWR